LINKAYRRKKPPGQAGAGKHFSLDQPARAGKASRKPLGNTVWHFQKNA
jgi:hypothetical protein